MCIGDISCDAWGRRPSFIDCKGAEDYTALDTALDNSKTKECEDLCKSQNSKGCCYLDDERGCLWKKNAVNWVFGIAHSGTAVTCDHKDSVEYEGMTSKQK